MLLSASRTNTKFAVMFLDLDNFKILNDTKGHDAGDTLLKEVANRLNAIVRESDTVARFGGDEFVILFSGPSHPVEGSCWLTTIANKIIEEISKPYDIFGFTHHCSASLGTVIFENQQCSASDLLKQADYAMYQAKQSGKNRMCLYKPN